MLDISKKSRTLRTATARAEIRLSHDTIKLIQENRCPKGDPFPVARVAATLAAKNTSQIIPYCHPLLLDLVDCRFEVQEGMIVVETEVTAIYKTGVEMEALTAASVAALTLYDMLKMVDETMEIAGLKLLSKTGGKSDFSEAFPEPLRAGVLVISDSIFDGRKADTCGQTILERFRQIGIKTVDYRIVPNEASAVETPLLHCADTLRLDLVLTTGGTGVSTRDCAPEVTQRVLDRVVPGIPEATRAYGQERTPHSLLSRGLAGLRGKTLIINLPGSRKGVAESLDALFPGVLHVLKTTRHGGHETRDTREESILQETRR